MDRRAPGPQIPIGEQVIPQQRHEIGERPGDPRPELQVLQQQDRDQCCPNLDLEGVGRCPHERLDLEILLDCLEEDLDLPAILVDRGDCRGCELQMVGEKNDRPLVFDVPHLDPAQPVGALLPGGGTFQFDELVFKDRTVLLDDAIPGVVFQAGHEKHALCGPFAEKA